MPMLGCTGLNQSFHVVVGITLYIFASRSTYDTHVTLGLLMETVS